MPHQCLKCGRVFEEGSSQLLRGCPDCGGNRFFFTKEPLNTEERSVISQEVSKDISERLMEVVEKQGPVIDGDAGRWVSVKPSDVRKVFSEELAGAAGVDGSIFEEPPLKPIDDEVRKSALEKIRHENQMNVGSPETIEIEHPGKYAIDVRGLLENEPIVVEKDGSYSIHLPSVFKMLDEDVKS